MSNKSKTGEYVDELQPLVNALADACERLDIPYVAMVQLDDSREAANLAGESIIMGSYHIVKDSHNISTPIAEGIKHLLDDDQPMGTETDPAKLN